MSIVWKPWDFSGLGGNADIFKAVREEIVGVVTFYPSEDPKNWYASIGKSGSGKWFATLEEAKAWAEEQLK